MSRSRPIGPERRHRSRRRRLLAFAAVAAIPFLSTPTASAQSSSLTIEFTSPGDGATITGTLTPEVAGNVYTGLGANVDGVRVVITYRDGAVVADKPDVCCDNAANGTVPFSMTAPVLARNGAYNIRATATGHFLLDGLAVAPRSADRSFVMAVPPAPPNLAAPQLVDRAVKLTWTPGRVDPDLMGYAVYRKVGSGGFQPLAGVPPNVTTYTDDKTPVAGGAIQYRVDALRQGAVLSNNANDWLARPSAAVVANVPAPPATVPDTQPGGNTTSTTPGGGLQPDGAVTSTSDLSSLFSSGGGSVPSFPTPTIPAIPDPGFSELLPFPSSSGGGKVDGRQQAIPGDASGRSALDSEADDDSNRRALLVPVAGGSVLCVAALHLRWLNRRIAIGAIGAAAAGGPGAGMGDLEPAEPDPDAFAPDREPVGAGSPGGRARA